MTLSEELEAGSKGTTSVSLVLVSSESLPTVTGNANQAPFKRIFLANIFDLIAHLCECSGDFMADRFRNFVIPVVAVQLRSLLQRHKSKQERLRLLQKSTSTHTESIHVPHCQFINPLPTTSLSEYSVSNPHADNNNNKTFDWSDTERQLVLSMLHCLTRALRQDDCGPALRSNLGSVGSMVLPLLEIGNDADIEGATMDCLKSVLQIDCDTLWRPLLELSGTGIPSCPLNIRSTSNSPSASMISDSFAPGMEPSCDRDDSLVAVRCRELLSFVELLPEQKIM